MSQFNVAFESTNNNFRTEFTNNAVNFDMSFDKVVKVYADDVYRGEYEITPKLYEDTVLFTSNLIMLNDMTIHEIPVTKTSNPYGGQTVLIG